MNQLKKLFDKVEELKKQQEEKEQTAGLYSIEMLQLTFLYLAKHGPIDAFYLWKEWIKQDELDNMINGIREELKAGRNDLLPDRDLMNLAQAMDCIKHFEKYGHLHLLTGNTDCLKGLSEEERFLKNNPSIMFVFDGKGGSCYVKETGKFFQSDYFNQYRQSNFGSYHANQHLQVNYKQYVEFFNEKINWPSQKAAAGLEKNI